MKKVILLLSVVFSLAATSCKKDYVCSCSISSTQPGSGAQTYEITYTDAKKGDAKRACVKTTQTSGGYTTTQDCKLK
ncbi:MAG TPA: hypothetical protein PLQ93_07120 [Bacteroidia bacterium]|nr:hypothetical protein [Bacteroidia bacterium]